LKQKGIDELNIVREQGDIDAAILWLGKSLKTDFKVGPEILRISLSGDQPEEVARLVNAVKDAYLDQLLKKETDRRAKLAEQLQQKLNEVETSLKSKRTALQVLTSTHKIDDPQTLLSKYTAKLQELATMEKNLLDVKLKESELQSDLKAQQKRLFQMDQEAIPPAV